MEHEPSFLTVWFNHWFGGPVLALLHALGIQPHDPAHPIPEYIVMEIFVFLFAVVFVLWLKRRLSVERPGAVQQCVEMLLTNPMGVGVRDLLDDMVGHGARRYMPVLGSIGIFILLSNLISLIPIFTSPTAHPSVPFACALLVFGYYHICGLRKHGPLKYGQHFLGPVLLMSPLMLLIELVSHLARLLSLTVRLWVNMVVSEMLYLIFLGLTLSLMLFAGEGNPAGYVLAAVPLIFPIVFILLHLFVGVLQAFVFTLLPVIYVGGAVAEEH
jgi:F-type H+-transporting ATPase subunit a